MNTCNLVKSYAHDRNRPGIIDAKRAVAQMADDILHCTARDGSVTESDLLTLGWTPSQIESHRNAAIRAAQMRGAR